MLLAEGGVSAIAKLRRCFCTLQIGVGAERRKNNRLFYVKTTTKFFALYSQNT